MKGRKSKYTLEHSGTTLDAFSEDDEGHEADERQIEDESGSVFDINILEDLLIKKLDQKDKDLYDAYYNGKQTQKEIAERLGVSQSVVSDRLNNKPLNTHGFSLIFIYHLAESGTDDDWNIGPDFLEPGS